MPRVRSQPRPTYQKVISRAHPEVHLSESCFQGLAKSFPKVFQKLDENSKTAQLSGFLSPTQVLSFFTSVSFFLACHSLIVWVSHSSFDLNKNSTNSKLLSLEMGQVGMNFLAALEKEC
jgi:hypothetical protein